VRIIRGLEDEVGVEGRLRQRTKSKEGRKGKKNY
jgi:hypothetical protein